MKRKIAMLLAALLALSCWGSALAENIERTVAKDANGALYFSMGGLVRLNPDGSRDQLTDSDVLYVQAAGDRVYFVESTPTEQVHIHGDTLETLCVLEPNGEIHALGETLLRYEHFQEQEPAYGYRDMTVYGDYIYYVGAEETDGFYTAIKPTFRDSIDDSLSEEDNPSPDEDSCTETVHYSTGAAVYRIPLSGGAPEKLISDLGNGDTRMAIANGRIAVCAVYVSPFFVYDYQDFMLYDMNGSLLKTFKNSSLEPFVIDYKPDSEFSGIVTSICTDGENIFASWTYSEGDFAASMLTDIRDVDSVLSYEGFFNPSKLTSQGMLSLTSNYWGVFYSDSISQSLHLRLRDGYNHRVLASLPEEYDWSDATFTELDGMAYMICERYSNGEKILELLRVPLAGGTVEILSEDGFVAAPDTFAPENYKPITTEDVLDTCVRDYGGAYSKELLSMLDKDTLALLRNTILAQHGYPFKTEFYRECFSKTSWYSENPDFSYADLSAKEMKTIENIKALEARG